MTVIEFATANKIDFSAVPIGKQIIDGKTPFKYTITVGYEGRKDTFEYTMGSGYVSLWGKMASHRQIKEQLDRVKYGELGYHLLKPIPPNVNDTLLCLSTDAQCIENYPLWEEFAQNLGYDVDSRKGHATYQACVDNYFKLKTVFGGKFHEFLTLTEEE